MGTEHTPLDHAIDPARRRLLRGATIGALAAPLLVACAEEDSAPSPAPSGTSDSPTEPEEPAATEEPDTGGGGALASTSEVPEGGGIVLSQDKVVLTQPNAGEFKAFTAVCTHQGCVVASVTEGTISCGCHGSQFSAADGSVKTGPATAALAEIEISVEGDQITRG